MSIKFQKNLLDTSFVVRSEYCVLWIIIFINRRLTRMNVVFGHRGHREQSLLLSSMALICMNPINHAWNAFQILPSRSLMLTRVQRHSRGNLGTWFSPTSALAAGVPPWLSKRSLNAGIMPPQLIACVTESRGFSISLTVPSSKKMILWHICGQRKVSNHG